MGRQLLSFQNQENLVKSFFEVVISLCTGKFITLKKFELLVKIKNTQIFGVTWLFWRSPNFLPYFCFRPFQRRNPIRADAHQRLRPPALHPLWISQADVGWKFSSQIYSWYRQWVKSVNQFAFLPPFALDGVFVSGSILVVGIKFN